MVLSNFFVPRASLKGSFLMDHPAQPTLAQEIKTATDYVRQLAPQDWQVLIILGSGLGPLAKEVENPINIPYSDIPGFAKSTVAGHSGQFVIGKLQGLSVGVMQGRVHFYEGHPIGKITLPIRVAKAMGAKVMVITNAVGGINRNFKVGDVMNIIDHINFIGLAGNNPLVGPNDETLGPRFPELTTAYTPSLQKVAQDVAKELEIPIVSGVLASVAGPAYETPAELRFLRMIGADAAGMSTANEVMVARHAGMDVVGFSSVTNVARLAADEGEPPSHQEVVDAANVVGPKLTKIIKATLDKIQALYFSQ